jgi:hypothetical protein
LSSFLFRSRRNMPQTDVFLANFFRGSGLFDEGRLRRPQFREISIDL